MTAYAYPDRLILATARKRYPFAVLPLRGGPLAYFVDRASAEAYCAPRLNVIDPSDGARRHTVTLGGSFEPVAEALARAA